MQTPKLKSKSWSAQMQTSNLKSKSWSAQMQTSKLKSKSWSEQKSCQKQSFWHHFLQIRSLFRIFATQNNGKLFPTTKYKHK